MRRERYITDNVFRALGVGSETGFAALRRKADGAARAASAGIQSEVPLIDAFGTVPLEELPSMVRSLDRDRQRRCTLRLMWPLTETAIPLLIDGGTPAGRDIPSEEAVQLQFLTAWYSFLEKGLPADAAKALERWTALYHNEAMERRLQRLLIDEDSASPDEAYNTVIEAQEAVSLHLLERVAAEAAKRWEVGETELASSLLKTLRECPLTGDWVERSLGPVTEYGERLEAKVKEITDEMPDWHLGDPTSVPPEVVRLSEFGRSMAGLYHAASSWSNAVGSWKTALIAAMRRESLRLNHERRNEEALQAVQEALKLADDPQQKDELERDIRVLKDILHGENAADPYRDIVPVRSAPSLGTINGIGTMLYGKTRFGNDPRRHFASVYLTFAFLPIFPLSRYLVEPMGGGQWRFYGKTKWTSWMKAHLAFSCLALVSLVVFFSNTPMGVAADGHAVEPQFSEPYRGTTVDDSTTMTEEEKEKKRKWYALEKEFYDVQAQFEALKSRLRDENSELDAKSQELQDLKRRIEWLGPDSTDHSLIPKYEALRSSYNRQVRAHNAAIESAKKLQRREDELLKAQQKYGG